MKTVRFSQVVARSGDPEVYTLWTTPEEDRGFQTALKEHRVLTVHQETVGSRKDYGEVGFTKDRTGNLFVFPKSLKTFEGRRVVGVKYDLLEAGRETAPKKVAKSAAAKPVKAAAEKSRKPASPAAPALRIFRSDDSDDEPAEPAKIPKIDRAKTAPNATALAKEVRRAMKLLQSGKAVAAYQTLEKALAAGAE